ncbi:hypothetical protein HY947_04975 [Candidatus Gottesmanbacteria bacterium]|nr:hypothetical protein [Candidatus Gottesmanbacteria bacterium]
MNSFQLPKNRNLPAWFPNVAGNLRKLAVKSKGPIQAKDFVPQVKALFLDKRIQKMDDLKNLFLFLLDEIEKKSNKKSLRGWEKELIFPRKSGHYEELVMPT